MSGHFFGASERGSGRHKVTLWRPEKMAEREKDAADAGDDGARKSDGKLILAALAGGSPAIFATMFFLRYRLTDMLLMIGLPVLSALNFYCYYLGFRGLALIP